MIVPSYYSNLASATNLQFLLDSSRLNLESKALWRKWLNLAPPQMELNFDSAIGRERIAAAASVVDSDAPAPLRSRNKLELYKGRIPAIKEKIPMNQNDMRTIEVLRALPLQGNNEALIQFLDRDLQEVAASGDARVDIMMLQGVSTLTIDINTTNNPDGVAYGSIDLLPNANQLQGVPTVWSNVASTPIDDIENFLQANWNLRGRRFEKILMSYELWINFKKTTQVRNYIASLFSNPGKTATSYTVTLENVNEYMAANLFPQIEIVNETRMVEVDGLPTYIKPFDSNNAVFVPAGKLGTLFNAISMEQLHPVPGKTYAKYGPSLIGKWCEQEPLREFTGMEMNAFPAVNVDGIFILKTNTVFAGPFV